MPSTLERNAVMAARSWVGPPLIQYRQRGRLAQDNTEMTRLFRLLRSQGKRRGTGADLGCTGPEGWCTSRLDQGRLETPMAQNSGLMQGKRGVIPVSYTHL